MKELLNKTNSMNYLKNKVYFIETASKDYKDSNNFKQNTILKEVQLIDIKLIHFLKPILPQLN
jgi:hypothetical protein